MKMEIQPVDPEFVRVWSRVKAPAPGGEEAAAGRAGAEWGEFLTGKLRAELQRGRDYRLLGLAGPAGDSGARARKLAAAWFFLSGERCPLRPQGAPGRYPGFGEALRALCAGEEQSESDYRAAAGRCQNEALEQVFAFCAQSCQETRRRLWAAAEGMWR